MTVELELRGGVEEGLRAGTAAAAAVRKKEEE